MDDQDGNGRDYISHDWHFRSVGEYQENGLKFAIEIGDRAGEGTPYWNLGDAYQSLGDDKKAIEHFQKQLKIAIEIGDQAREGSAYEYQLGIAYDSLGDCQKAIEYFEKQLKIAIEIGDGAEEEIANQNLGSACQNCSIT